MKLISSVFVICVFFVIHIECILDGSLTSVTYHPYIVSIRDDKGRHFAGGAIINNHLILTSARVLDGHNEKTISVQIGTNSVTKGGLKFNIEKIIKHKDDIAVLRTVDEIIFSNEIQPVILPTVDINSDKSKAYYPGDAIVAGWGKAKNSDRLNYTTELISRSYPLLDTVNCKLRLQEIKGQSVPTLDGNKLCTVQNLPVSGLCNGDLGSPLAAGKGSVLIGIASWFHVNATEKGQTCSNGYPNVYTSVYPYVDWIADGIAKGNGNMVRATSFVLIAFGITIISIF